MEEVEYNCHARIDKINQQVLMSQHIYAVLPYDSGIGIDPEDVEQCVFGYNVPELKGIEAELSYSHLTDDIIMFQDFLIINTCLRVSDFCQNPKNGYNSLRKDVYLMAKRLGLEEVWYVPEYYTDDMNEAGYTYNTLLRDMHGKYKDSFAELSVKLLKGKKCYEFYHDNFSDIVL